MNIKYNNNDKGRLNNNIEQRSCGRHDLFSVIDFNISRKSLCKRSMAPYQSVRGTGKKLMHRNVLATSITYDHWSGRGGRVEGVISFSA